MTTSDKKYRLLTRSDFDGLVCALLLKEMGILGEIKFVHPKDMQDGGIEVTEDDILTNLPYVEGCHLCFDHHSSEEIRNKDKEVSGYVLDSDADSAARVVYEYYGGRKKFPNISPEMMEAVDKADAARFSREEILKPEGWPLLSFMMDARTGLGRFREFRVSNYQLMMDLIDNCRDLSIEEILQSPDVSERVDLYQEQRELAQQQIERCGTIHGNAVVLDLRNEETIYATNRFTIYSIFPMCNISIHAMWGKQKQNTVFTIGKSILDRSCCTDVGELCFRYNGGGHEAAGTCQVAHDQAERVLDELISKINADEEIEATVGE
jgi:nanoRNase/pAp phosphatase (c-di-AMP/oligoRNAs hydrolase)